MTERSSELSSPIRFDQAAEWRAARGLLDWTQQQLADAARIGIATVRLFESEFTEPRQATLTMLRHAFEAAGVEFTNGDRPDVVSCSLPPKKSAVRELLRLNEEPKAKHRRPYKKTDSGPAHVPNPSSFFLGLVIDGK